MVFFVFVCVQNLMNQSRGLQQGQFQGAAGQQAQQAQMRQHGQLQTVQGSHMST